MFTAQLRKSRLATNQANARSAYAAITAKILDDNTGTPTNNIAYTYNVSTGVITVNADNYKENPQLSATSKPISGWGVDDAYDSDGNQKLGDSVAKTWTAHIATDGTLKGYEGTLN